MCFVTLLILFIVLFFGLYCSGDHFDNINFVIHIGCAGGIRVRVCKSLIGDDDLIAVQEARQNNRVRNVDHAGFVQIAAHGRLRERRLAE